MLAALAMVSLCGCVTLVGTPAFDDVELPRPGSPISDGVWNAADQAKRTGLKDRPSWSIWEAIATSLFGGHQNGGEKSEWRRERSLYWRLPQVRRHHVFAVLDENQKALSHYLSCVDLGVPLLCHLPLVIAVSDDSYDRGRTRPVRSQRFCWTPLWTYATRNGADGGAFDTRFHAFGLPLLFSKVDVESQHIGLALRFLTSFWSLGPTSIRVEAGTPDTRTETASVFCPAFLGGLLGMMLWTDFHQVNPEAEAWGHGPLSGHAGWYEKRTTSPDRETDLLRLVLAGILWLDRSHRNADNEATESRHGPLWSMIGWGRADGRPTVRVLWVPVPMRRRDK